MRLNSNLVKKAAYVLKSLINNKNELNTRFAFPKVLGRAIQHLFMLKDSGISHL